MNHKIQRINSRHLYKGQPVHKDNLMNIISMMSTPTA